MTMLRGWKEIARYLRADERTVRRWEARGLPVYRIPGEERSSVYADTAELDKWLNRPVTPNPMSNPPEPAGGKSSWLPEIKRAGLNWPLRRPFGLAAGVVICASITGLLFTKGIGHSTSKSAVTAPYANTSPAGELVSEASLQNARGVPDGFRRAITLSRGALEKDPSNANAYAQLAFAYIRLPDADVTVNRHQVYDRAQQAARKALELDPRSWLAHSAMGFIEYGYHWNFVAGIRHFQAVIRINPARGPGHNQLGIAMLDMGDTKDALKELKLSARLEAANPTYRAFYAQAQYLVGDRKDALSVWNQILADNPNLILVREWIADDALAHHNWRIAVDQWGKIAELTHDRTGQQNYETARRLADRNDIKALSELMLKLTKAEMASGRAGYFDLARVYALFNAKVPAFHALQKALANREPPAIGMRTDLLLISLQNDPRFARLATTYGIIPASLRGSVQASSL